MRPHRPQSSVRLEDGFTLVEMLATLVILGILAAVSLPTFVGKDQVAMDAQAKSNVRNLFTHVQSCFVEKLDYTLCDQANELDLPPGISWGNGAGQVKIRRGGSRTTRLQVSIRGFSEAVSNGRRHRFDFVKRTGPPPDTRTCRTSSGNDAGGCNDGTW